MSAYDDLVRISCGHCGKETAYLAWKSTTVGGDLPPDTFQCPHCRQAFRRIASPEQVTLETVNSVL